MESFSGTLRAAESKEYRYVIVEGLLVLNDDNLREAMDLKIFVTASPETCLYRRILRNTALFGQTPEFIGNYYLKCARRREAEFCLPTRECADFIIDNEVSFDEGLEKTLLALKTLDINAASGV